MPKNHVVISGTGRAGTTFLVELLTHLGLQTGYKPEEVHLHWNQQARAGMEHDIRDENSPYIIKNPGFCEHVEEVLKRSDIVIEHVFIPMRDLQAAAESRRFVSESALSEWSPFKRIIKRILGRQGVPGGLAQTQNPREQEVILLNRIYKLILALSNTAIPVTLLRYPRIVKDAPYLFSKLQPILGSTTYDRFRAVFEKTARPDLMHSFNPKDS